MKSIENQLKIMKKLCKLTEIFEKLMEKPRTPQDASEAPQDAPQTRPRRPKSCPRRPQTRKLLESAPKTNKTNRFSTVWTPRGRPQDALGTHQGFPRTQGTGHRLQTQRSSRSYAKTGSQKTAMAAAIAMFLRRCPMLGPLLGPFLDAFWMPF